MYHRREPAAFSGNFILASDYYDAGLNLIPLKVDGSKKPRIRWKKYTTEVHPWYQASHWFANLGEPSGIAILCGITSGNLEVIDHDDPGLFLPWCRPVHRQAPGLLARQPLVGTPDEGRHVYYRCPTVAGNQLLARDEEGNVLIETRGQGGYVVAPGSPPSVHPSGKPYRLLLGALTSIPEITPEERELMLAAARSFNRYSEPKKERVAPAPAALPAPEATSDTPTDDFLADLYGDFFGPCRSRPGDDFNCRASWPDILEPLGWTIRSVKEGTIYWRKPESSGTEHHATTNHDGTGLFYLFSTSCPGLEADRAYTKFAVYTVLNWAGDFQKAAKRLAQEGYGF